MAGTGDKLLTAAEIKEVTDTKVNISDVVNALNSTSINKPLSAAQGKALNDGKVNKTDTIAIEHGGTNATSASSARTNIDVYSKSEVDTAIAQSTAGAMAGNKFYRASNGFSSGSINITFAQVTSHALIFVHGNGSIFNMFYVSVYSGGSTSNVSDLLNRIGTVTVTSNANVITVTNNSGSNVRVDCLLFAGGIDSVA